MFECFGIFLIHSLIINSNEIFGYEYDNMNVHIIFNHIIYNPKPLRTMAQ